MKLVEGENSRYCTKCQELKHFDDFYKKKYGKYGLYSLCKECLTNKAYTKRKFSEEHQRKNRKFFYEKVTRKKSCTKCLKTKDFDCFYNQKNYQHGLMSVCIECLNDYYSNYRKEIPEKDKECREKNKENKKQKPKKKKFKFTRSERERIRYKSDPNFRLYKLVKARIQKTVKKGYKSKSTEKLLGCTIEEFRKHIESQWDENMNWRNYGVHGWHIDHWIPVSNWDLTCSLQQSVAFHYTNTQPMWAEDNWSKSGKIPELNIKINLDYIKNFNKSLDLS